MLISVIVTLCLVSNPNDCIRKIVTDQATLSECSGPFALQVLPKWIEENGYAARGYRLAKWGCVIGGRKANEA